MEAPNILEKLPIILILIFGKYNLGSKIGFELNQILDSQIYLFAC